MLSQIHQLESERTVAPVDPMLAVAVGAAKAAKTYRGVIPVAAAGPLRTGLNRGCERLILIGMYKDDEARPQLAQAVW